MAKPRPAPSLLDTVVCARERLKDASRVATYLKEELLSLESGLTVDEVAGAWEPEPDHLGELVREHRLRGVILGVQSVENYSPHIMKQDFRRRRNGRDAMSWREEKPQM